MASDNLVTFKNRFNKALGEDSLFFASEMTVPRRFTSGSLSLDVALGGGWPANHWSEVLGKESSGKTSTILKSIAANQKINEGFEILWVAGEHYNYEWASKLGVDNERVLVFPSQEMEVALEIILQAASSRSFDMVVLDSYPSLVPSEESEKAMDEFSVATGAKLFNKFWRKAGPATSRHRDGSERPCAGIVINQWRDKIGGFSPRGTPQTSPGGHGKDYAYYVRLDIQRDDYIHEKRPGVKDPVFVGQTIKMKTVKNKSFSPQQVAFVDFYFRDAPLIGFRAGDYDLAKEYVALGIMFGVIRKSGGWYYFADRKWQGQPSLEVDMRCEVELQKYLAAEVLERAKNPHSQDIMEEVS